MRNYSPLVIAAVITVAALSVIFSKRDTPIRQKVVLVQEYQKDSILAHYNYSDERVWNNEAWEKKLDSLEKYLSQRIYLLTTVATYHSGESTEVEVSNMYGPYDSIVKWKCQQYRECNSRLSELERLNNMNCN